MELVTHTWKTWEFLVQKKDHELQKPCLEFGL